MGNACYFGFTSPSAQMFTLSGRNRLIIVEKVSVPLAPSTITCSLKKQGRNDSSTVSVTVTKCRSLWTSSLLRLDRMFRYRILHRGMSHASTEKAKHSASIAIDHEGPVIKESNQNDKQDTLPTLQTSNEFSSMEKF